MESFSPPPNLPNGCIAIAILKTLTPNLYEESCRKIKRTSAATLSQEKRSDIDETEAADNLSFRSRSFCIRWMHFVSCSASKTSNDKVSTSGVRISELLLETAVMVGNP